MSFSSILHEHYTIRCRDGKRIRRCDGTYQENIRTCKDNLQLWFCCFFVLEIEIKRIYSQCLFRKVIFCRGSESHSLEWEATRAPWEWLRLVMRKSLLDFPGSRLKKSALNEFCLSSFLSVSHAWCTFWTWVLTEQVVDIYKNPHQRVAGGNLFTFCIAVASLPWSTLHPKRLFLSIMNHFHIHWTLKLLFGLRIKNILRRQQIWQTKACAQDIAARLASASMRKTH